jgi:pimeloyl-ACP methyl ester carboxylesterase
MRNLKWKNVPARTIDVGGVAFAYRELGPNSSVPVIFLHHLMAVLDDWDPRVIDDIAAQRRVIAFDNRGVGASGGSVLHTIEEMGRGAIAFIRALGLKKVDLFGFSLGGAVAQMVALQAPDLLRRIILAGTGFRGGGGIDEINRIAVAAYLKAALTLSDPRNFLFFPRTPDGKRGAKDYFSRLKERTKDRDKRISLRARRAQLKVIRTAGLSAPDDLSVITAGFRGKRRPRLHGRQQPFGRHGSPSAKCQAHDLSRFRARWRLSAPPCLCASGSGLPC